MTRLKELLRQPGFHIFLCCLLLILLNWPFLAISGQKGLTPMFVYLFLLWAAFIALLSVVQRWGRDDADGNRNERGG